MRRTRYIFVVACWLMSTAGVRAQDFVRLGERLLSGTARYVGMSGAMTAIGGDPSASMDNPAGLGLYRRSEVSLTFDYTWDRTWQDKNTASANRVNRFYVPQASVVFNVGPYGASETGVLFNSVMLSYRRAQSYNRTMTGMSDGDVSLGSLIASTGVDIGITYPSNPLNAGNQLRIDERGVVNEVAIDWGMNISNMWYVGVGIHIQSYSLSSDGNYKEVFAEWQDVRTPYYNQNVTTLLYSGVGCNFSAGLIYRPLSWLRLGFSLHTPSLGSIRIYSQGTIWAQSDSLRTSKAPDVVSPVNDFHSPLRTSVSAAFQCGYYGMLSLQYDYGHQSQEKDVHTLRAGLEVVPIPGLYINAGYAYESTFSKNDVMVPIERSFDRQDTYFQRLRSTQYASAAIGFRGKHAIVQAAYQYRWQGINLYAHEKSQAYGMNTDTHRIVLTVGWHRGW